MLCQFSVKNYKSFKEMTTLDMQATNIDLNDASILIDKDGTKYLPLAAIYGPNGGGKTNILDALYCLKTHVIKPVCAACDNNECNGKKYPSHSAVPFKLNKDYSSKPTEFEIFFRTKIAEYKYIIHLKNEKVTYENLSKINLGGNRIINIFIRDIYSIENCKLSKALSKISTKDVSETLPWLSYFAITNLKNPVISDVFSFFHNLMFNNIAEYDNDHQIVIPDGKMKELEMKMLKEMDIDVEDYIYEKDVRSSNSASKFRTIHIVNGNKIELNIEEESRGTIKLFALMPTILQCLIEGNTLIVDELDATLHPKLLKYIIELFKSRDSNKKNAQLIFTSQDISTMTPEIFRRDEIWFAAKNYEQASSLYSLVEIKKENGKLPRNDEKYGKQYLEGRYGADPYLKRIINWEDAK